MIDDERIKKVTFDVAADLINPDTLASMIEQGITPFGLSGMIQEAIRLACHDYYVEKTKLRPASEYDESMGVVLWFQKIGDGYNYVARRKQGDLTHEPGRYDHFQLINIGE